MRQENNNYTYHSILNLGYWSNILEDVNVNYWVDKCYQIKNHIPSSKKSNIEGYQSPNIFTHPDFFDLISVLSKHIKKFKKTPNLIIQSMWVNISSYGHANSLHVHNKYKDEDGVKVESGVFYLKTNSKSGQLRFYNPIDLSIQYGLSPKPSQIVLFNSDILHSVDPNLSKEDRISIAFNYKIYG
tara:strand:- start:2688 stop:3242 length:555 start_codon:yes stop_codon:yes gene_type:complete